jgi:hypothetical protein
MTRITFLFFLAIVISATIIYAQDPMIITNEEFANKPFGKILSVKNIKDVMHGRIFSKKNPIKNKFIGGFDTLLIFTSNEAEFTFYKSTEKTFFYRANIFGKGVYLTKSVQIGMSKDSFAKALGIKSFKGDLIIVKNSTDYANHKFYFKNNKLAKIELDAGLD